MGGAVYRLNIYPGANYSVDVLLVVDGRYLLALGDDYMHTKFLPAQLAVAPTPNKYAAVLRPVAVWL